MDRKEFHYQTGEEARVGDHILNWGTPAVVELVILPGTDDAKDYQVPEGGILIKEGRGGGFGRLLMTPPDGDLWEDLDFVSRGQPGDGFEER